jgi:very-short-patch-repair endonuclease
VGKHAFQEQITAAVRRLYSKHIVEVEHSFNGALRNPKTGARLRVDIYVPRKKLVIECDGPQHWDKNNWLNVRTRRLGYTPAYETDRIKERFCQKRRLRTIRIRYGTDVSVEHIGTLLRKAQGRREGKEKWPPSPMG